MGVTKEIAYFNAIVLKSSISSNNDWHIEESRIKGGFNNTIMDLGVRAYLVDENYANERRKNAMIFSGLYNSKTGVNNLNQFPIGAEITKAVDNANGSIQKLHAEDTNLIIFQEDKVNRAPVDKDFIFTAEGTPISATSKLFIGAIIPYAGKYGISKNPESFAVRGNRKYFADKKRGAILRLSSGIGGGDGITEISFNGMRDWFKDNLKNATKIVGIYDDVKDHYVISINNGSNYTLAFDEGAKGWSSFYTYYPEAGFSLNNMFYTFKETTFWEHYQTSNYNKFYSLAANNSNVELVLNTQPSISKTFKTLSYEGTAGWSASNIKTNLDDSDFTDSAENIAKHDSSYDFDLVGGNIFNKKENKYQNFLRNSSAIKEDEIIFGEQISGVKGFYMNVTLSTSAAETNKKELFAVSSEVSGITLKNPAPKKSS
jgi:hypothetical protein